MCLELEAEPSVGTSFHSLTLYQMLLVFFLLFLNLGLLIFPCWCQPLMGVDWALHRCQTVTGINGNQEESTQLLSPQTVSRNIQENINIPKFKKSRNIPQHERASLFRVLSVYLPELTHSEFLCMSISLNISALSLIQRQHLNVVFDSAENKKWYSLGVGIRGEKDVRRC